MNGGLLFFPPWSPIGLMYRAGHFRYFLIFSIIKNYLFAFFIKLISISAPALFKKPTSSQINLIKNVKNNFYYWKNLKNTESAHLCEPLNDIVELQIHHKETACTESCASTGAAPGSFFFSIFLLTFRNTYL